MPARIAKYCCGIFVSESSTMLLRRIILYQKSYSQLSTRRSINSLASRMFRVILAFGGGIQTARHESPASLPVIIVLEATAITFIWWRGRLISFPRKKRDQLRQADTAMIILSRVGKQTDASPQTAPMAVKRPTVISATSPTIRLCSIASKGWRWRKRFWRMKRREWLKATRRAHIAQRMER
jgi:hypothetical protein